MSGQRVQGPRAAGGRAGARPRAPAMSWKRPAGCFSSALRMMRSSSASTGAIEDGRGGGLERWASRSWVVERPVNGSWPVNELVGHDAERVHVGAGVDGARRRTAPAPCTRACPPACPAGVRALCRRAAELGDAEVDQLHEVAHARAAPPGRRCRASGRGGRRRARGRTAARRRAAAGWRSPAAGIDVPRCSRAGQRLALQVLHHDVVPVGRQQREVEDARRCSRGR